jgi:hypothetical protein
MLDIVKYIKRIKMKTAKEMCEDLKNYNLNLYLGALYEHGGILKFSPSEYTNGNPDYICYSGKMISHPDKQITKALIDLGYTVEEKIVPYIQYVVNSNPWYLPNNAHKIKHIGKEVIISACCGDK